MCNKIQLGEEYDKSHKTMVMSIITRSSSMPAGVQSGIVRILTEEELRKIQEKVFSFDFTKNI